MVARCRNYLLETSHVRIFAKIRFLDSTSKQSVELRININCINPELHLPSIAGDEVQSDPTKQ